jgi:hypothetical protein
MNSDVLPSLLTAITGGFVGYFIKAYEERPQPALLVDNVSFANDNPQQTVIDLPQDILDLDAISYLVPETIETSASYQYVKERASAAERACQKLEKVINEAPSFVEAINSMRHMDSPEELYRNHLDRVRGQDSDFFTALVVYFAYILRKHHIRLTEMPEIYPEHFSKHGYLKDVSFVQNKKITGDSEDISILMALELLQPPTGWFPDDLTAAVDAATKELPSQLVSHIQLRDKLNDLVRKLDNDSTSTFLKVHAMLVNNGRTSITFDNVGVLGISGVMRAFFLVPSDSEQTGKISIPSNSCRELVLITESSLASDESRQLLELYNTAIFMLPYNESN